MLYYGIITFPFLSLDGCTTDAAEPSNGDHGQVIVSNTAFCARGKVGSMSEEGDEASSAPAGAASDQHRVAGAVRVLEGEEKKTKPHAVRSGGDSCSGGGEGGDDGGDGDDGGSGSGSGSGSGGGGGVTVTARGLVAGDPTANCMGVPNTGNGGAGPHYTWTQTLAEVVIMIPVPLGQ